MIHETSLQQLLYNIMSLNKAIPHMSPMLVRIDPVPWVRPPT